MDNELLLSPSDNVYCKGHCYGFADVRSLVVFSMHWTTISLVDSVVSLEGRYKIADTKLLKLIISRKIDITLSKNPG
jgi:hypothetical protein